MRRGLRKIDGSGKEVASAGFRQELVIISSSMTARIFVFLLFAASAAAQPNVVILFTDDQGTLDANCYGSTDLITPNIDRLAETGVRFTQAYAHTVCCPARAMLMTGRHPQRGGVHHWTQGNMHGAKTINMALEEFTLAEALKEAGYRTALFGKWHLGAHRDFGPKKQGFDEFFGIRDGFIDNYNHYFLHQKGFHDLYEGTEEINAPDQYFPELMIQRSLKFIDESKDGPFFLYVPFNIPHYPEQALKQHEELYKDLEDPARRSYGAIVTTTDHYIGQILDKLDSLSLTENTIVIFMSDNGHSEETGNKIRVDEHKSGLPKDHFYGASGGGSTGKWIGQKGTFLEGGVRVPAIISYAKKLPQGEVRGQVVTAMDWFPTVLNLCGVERKADSPALDGHSLLPILDSKNAESKYGGVLHFAWGTGWAVRDGDWKLIGRDLKDGKVKTTLHNIGEDEPEVKNHAAEQPEIVSRLTAAHEKWAAEVAPK
ncbi:MAG: arylsulfatase A-like enzyme [Verrucomicrobiales bacterium]